MFTPNLPDPVAEEVAEASRESRGCFFVFLYTVGAVLLAIGILSMGQSETTRAETIGFVVTCIGVLILIITTAIKLKPVPRSSGLLDSPVVQTKGDASTAERLADLQALLEEGLITQLEFDAKRQEILDQI